MKKITLFVIIIWAAIGVSVAAISIPAISSDVGKTPALPQDSIKTTAPESSVDISNETNQDQKKNNNSDQSQLKKQKSMVNPGQNKIKTKQSSKNNN